MRGQVIKPPRSTFFCQSNGFAVASSDFQLIESMQDGLPGHGYRRKTPRIGLFLRQPR